MGQRVSVCRIMGCKSQNSQHDAYLSQRFSQWRDPNSAKQNSDRATACMLGMFGLYILTSAFILIELVWIISTHFLGQTLVKCTIVELFAEKSQMTGRRWSMPPLRSWRLHGRSWRQGCHESEENASEMLGQLRLSCLSCLSQGLIAKLNKGKADKEMPVVDVKMFRVCSILRSLEI